MSVKRVAIGKDWRGVWVWRCMNCCGHRSLSFRTHADAIRAATAHLVAESIKDNTQRYRCTVVGCNPKLWGEAARDGHASTTGHRTAKWPVRSAAGKRRAKARNRSGYYDKYNVGHKARGSSGYRSRDEYGDDSHPFSTEALGQD